MGDSEGPPLLWSSVATPQPGPVSGGGGHRPPSCRTQHVHPCEGDGLPSPLRPSLEVCRPWGRVPDRTQPWWAWALGVRG